MKVLCDVGQGWTIMAIPGTNYTFGMGAVCWGPIPLDDVDENISFDCNGLATAIAK